MIKERGRRKKKEEGNEDEDGSEEVKGYMERLMRMKMKAGR